MSIKTVFSDREQWALFVGHMVLGLLVLSGPLYFAARAVAGDVADEHVKEVKQTIEAVKSDVQQGRVDRQALKSAIEEVSGDVADVKHSTDLINTKLDKIIDRQLDAAARNGH